MELLERQNRLTRSGFSLVEMLMGIAIGSIIATVVMSVFLQLSRSASSLTNYSVKSHQDRMATEIIGGAIRDADLFLSPLTSTQLTIRGSMITNNTTNVFTNSFWFDSNKRALYWRKGTKTNLLISNCRSLQFSYYQRNTNRIVYEIPLISTSSASRMVNVEWTTTVSTNNSRNWIITNSAYFLNRRR